MGEIEFLIFLKALNRDAQKRMQDLLETPIMALASSPRSPYYPSREGKIICEVIDNLQMKPNFRSLTTIDQKHVQDVVRASGGEAALLSSSTQHAKLRLNEGFNVYKGMLKDSGNKVDVLIKILPQMAETADAKQLVLKACQGDKSAFLALKQKLGSLIRPMFGQPNGYYNLDLSIDFDRLCLAELVYTQYYLSTNSVLTQY